MITCSKEYRDIPFAHRQHNHDGHCARIHGHNWSFKFIFGATELDENNFVIDFGKLKPLKATLEQFDHALVLNEDDPQLTYLQEVLESFDLADIIVVPSASSEGLAEMLGRAAHILVQGMTDGRVSVISCTVEEDSKNSATWHA